MDRSSASWFPNDTENARAVTLSGRLLARKQKSPRSQDRRTGLGNPVNDLAVVASRTCQSVFVVTVLTPPDLSPGP